MIITIDGQAADLHIENEKILGEVLSTIASWLGSQGYGISGFSVDGKSVEGSTFEKACAQSLSELASLDIQTVAPSLQRREAYTEAERFLSLRAKREDGRIEQLDASWQESPAASFIADFDNSLKAALDTVLSGERTEETTLHLIKTRLREVEDPKPELSKVLDELEALSSRMEEVPIELQTGKDAQAAATLRDFSDSTEKLVRLVPLLQEQSIDLEKSYIEDMSFQSFMADLVSALKELLSAYTAGDSILVGDLSEYELAPRLRSLAAALRTAQIS
ncbi:hypothetical protein MASR2M78_04240 [Treponema sp.]